MVRTHAAALAAAVIGLSGTLARADVALLGSAKDNTLYESTTGALSNGAGSGMFAGLTGQPAKRRALVAFDLSTIPAGSTITGVTLTLHMTQGSAAAFPISLHRATSTWGEGTSNANAGPGGGGGGAPAATGDATWLHRFSPATPWLSAGGDFGPSSAVSSVAGLGTYTWSTTAMIADVQGWLNGTSVNAGWVILGDESTPGSAKRFGTREAAAADRPVLQVQYSVPAPGAAVPLLAIAALVRRRR